MCSVYQNTEAPKSDSRSQSVTLCDFIPFRSLTSGTRVRLKEFQPHAGVGVQLNISELPSSFTDCAPSFLPFIVPVS